MTRRQQRASARSEAGNEKRTKHASASARKRRGPARQKVIIPKTISESTTTQTQPNPKAKAKQSQQQSLAIDIASFRNATAVQCVFWFSTACAVAAHRTRSA